MADRVGEIVKVVWEDVASWEGVWIYPAEAIEYRDFLIVTYGKSLYLFTSTGYFQPSP